MGSLCEMLLGIAVLRCAFSALGAPPAHPSPNPDPSPDPNPDPNLDPIQDPKPQP